MNPEETKTEEVVEAVEVETPAEAVEEAPAAEVVEAVEVEEVKEEAVTA